MVAGEILPQPNGCPQELYGLMVQCWAQEPHMRPSFKDIAEQLRQWRRAHMLLAMDSSNASECGIAQYLILDNLVAWAFWAVAKVAHATINNNIP